jgi:glycine cleavage system H protein
VEEINEVLSSEPNLLNKSAENKGRHGGFIILSLIDYWTGWLCKIKLSDPSEVAWIFPVNFYHTH